MGAGDEEMPVVIELTSAGNGQRKVTIQANNATIDTPQGKARKVNVVQVYGVQNAQTQFIINFPVAMDTTLWKGSQYTVGPNENIYIVDDPTSENNSTLITSSGDFIEWQFTPTLTDGTPI